MGVSIFYRDSSSWLVSHNFYALLVSRFVIHDRTVGSGRKKKQRDDEHEVLPSISRKTRVMTSFETPENLQEYFSD